MISFKQKLMALAVVLGMSFAAVAQRGNDNSNKRPKKPDNPPQVVVKEKPPPQKGKKP